MARTGCREAIEAFEEFLGAPEEHRAEIAGALDHFSACPACRERAGHLVRLLAAGNADEDVLTCEACQEILPGFLAAESLGECSGAECACVRRHLETCPHCAAVHASLAGLLSLAHGDRGAEPPGYPGLDLSFLRDLESSARGQPAALERAGALPAARPERPPSEGLRSDLWQPVIRGVARVAAAIPVLIGRAGATFGALAAPLTVQLAPVPVYRDKRPPASDGEARDFREMLELPHHDTNVTLKVSLGPVFGDQGIGRCYSSVALAVNQIAPPKPIAQARVTLRDADGGLLEGASTGEDGVVLFRDLDVGGYLIRVEHAGKAWELQLVLRSS